MFVRSTKTKMHYQPAHAALFLSELMCPIQFRRWASLVTKQRLKNATCLKLKLHHKHLSAPTRSSWWAVNWRRLVKTRVNTRVPLTVSWWNGVQAVCMNITIRHECTTSSPACFLQPLKMLNPENQVQSLDLLKQTVQVKCQILVPHLDANVRPRLIYHKQKPCYSPLSWGGVSSTCYAATSQTLQVPM